MDLESSPHLESLAKCCCCRCNCLTWHRSVERKFNLISDEHDFSTPLSLSVVGFDIQNEYASLHEMLGQQEKVIQELHTELEEERSASSSGADEAMSMILKLQMEKAEAQMEARQFKLFVEEKMAHDSQKLVAFEDLLYKMDQAIQSLNYEVRAYKHRLMSFCSEVDANFVGTDTGCGAGTSGHGCCQSVFRNVEAQFIVRPFVDYPLLKCNLKETPTTPDLSNNSPFHIHDKYAPRETPRFQDLDCQINQLERTLKHDQINGEYPNMRNFLEKVIGQSPRQSRQATRVSSDSFGSSSTFVKETNQDCSTNGKQRSSRGECVKKTDDYTNIDDYGFLRGVDYASDLGDDMTDRIYTLDSIQSIPYNGLANTESSRICDDDLTTPRESLARVDIGEMDIKKLYSRLQALEAERESMKQDLISMRAEKVQLMLVKAIAQHLCQELSVEKNLFVKTPSPVGKFSLISVLKWVVSLVLWRKKSRKSKYMFRLSYNNVGLLSLFERNPLRQWRCLTEHLPSEIYL